MEDVESAMDQSFLCDHCCIVVADAGDCSEEEAADVLAGVVPTEEHVVVEVRHTSEAEVGQTWMAVLVVGYVIAWEEEDDRTLEEEDDHALVVEGDHRASLAEEDAHHVLEAVGDLHASEVVAGEALEEKDAVDDDALEVDVEEADMTEALEEEGVDEEEAAHCAGKWVVDDVCSEAVVPHSFVRMMRVASVSVAGLSMLRVEVAYDHMEAAEAVVVEGGTTWSIQFCVFLLLSIVLGLLPLTT